MKTVLFTIATKQFDGAYRKFLNSLRKFHPDIEVRRISDEEIKPFKDPHIFFRATPIFADQLFKEGYELVIKLDVDQIITGSLDRILRGDYEVGTVINYNRVDPLTYGAVTVGTINPGAYYNCGFVAMTSHSFVKHWLKMCYSEHFDRLQYREQDLLNLLTHFGTYKVTCFDEYTPEYSSWHGLIAKGEGLKMKIKGGEIILPPGEDGYPKHEKVIRSLHDAGGSFEKPIQETYRTKFPEDVIRHLTDLMKD